MPLLIRPKLEKLLALLDSPALDLGKGELDEFQVAEARDLVVQIISELDGLQEELRPKNTRRQ
jgi:hypothetical protein